MGWAILSELHQILAGRFSARSFPNWDPRHQPEDIASLEPSTEDSGILLGGGGTVRSSWRRRRGFCFHLRNKTQTLTGDRPY